MIAGTHIAFASALYLGGAALFEYDTDLVGWALAAGASLLPDVDLPTSKLGRVLFWLSTRLEKQHTRYFSGEMQVGSQLAPVADIDLYHPVSFNGKVLRLHYSRAQELGSYLDRAAIQGEVYVRFWLKPGDPPVELTLAEEEPKEVIPEVLREYL